MTNRNALNYFFRRREYFNGVEDNFSEAEEFAIEALEKQIPKMITHEATLYKCCTCPNCKNVIDKFEKWEENRVRITYKYCYFCGQALDWSDTE